MTQALLVKDGVMIDYTPVAAVAAGDVILQGTLIGVAPEPIAAGVKGALQVTGVADFTKVAGDIWLTAGAIAYWDDAAKVATSTIGSNEYLGKVVSTATTGTTVRVTLAGAANASGAIGWGSMPSALVAASGAASGASPVAIGFSKVTGADATKAVTLPTAVAGAVCVIKNSVAAVLNVFPATGDKINGGTATTGQLAMAASTIAMFVAYDATDWYSVPLLPS
jgi:predicted RecA/RadA family phage recombinase